MQNACSQTTPIASTSTEKIRYLGGALVRNSYPTNDHCELRMRKTRNKNKILIFSIRKRVIKKLYTLLCMHSLATIAAAASHTFPQLHGAILNEWKRRCISQVSSVVATACDCFRASFVSRQTNLNGKCTRVRQDFVAAATACR